MPKPNALAEPMPWSAACWKATKSVTVRWPTNSVAECNPAFPFLMNAWRGRGIVRSVCASQVNPWCCPLRIIQSIKSSRFASGTRLLFLRIVPSGADLTFFVGLASNENRYDWCSKKDAPINFDCHAGSGHQLGRTDSVSDKSSSRNPPSISSSRVRKSLAAPSRPGNACQIF